MEARPPSQINEEEMSAAPIFHPQDSRIGVDQLARFLNSELTGNLIEVPGIGRDAVARLGQASIAIAANGQQLTIPGVTSTFGLIGVFMMFKTNGTDGRLVGPVEHVQRFYLWWCSLGVAAGFRAGVVHALAEKINISFPGIYIASEYDER